MTERVLLVLVTPLWLVSAAGWAGWTTAHFLTHPWELL